MNAKSVILAFGLLLAALGFPSASYAAHKAGGLQCGQPRPDPRCFTPTPAPTPPTPPVVSSTCTAADLSCIITFLTSLKAEVIQVLNETVTDQAGVLNTTTGEAWDPYLVTCLDGTPGQGTAGQNGYVAPQAGLIAWINGLQGPNVATVPPIVDPNNAAEAAEHARLIVLAGLQDVNVLVAGLQVSGPPASIMQPCSAFIQNAAITVPTQIAGQWAAIGTIAVKFFPAAFALHKAKFAEPKP